jgi:hypothetical protein
MQREHDVLAETATACLAYHVGSRQASLSISYHGNVANQSYSITAIDHEKDLR